MNNMTIGDIAKQLYIEHPTDVLYHYTSLDAIDGIVGSKSLRATDIRYFSDAAEMRHTGELLRVMIGQRIEEKGNNFVLTNLLGQFREWLSHRITAGHMLFAASFTANGNLLSQWRGYCTHGRGISLGFNPERISKCADKQSFQITRCIYDSTRQHQIVGHVIDAIEALAQERGENKDASKRHPSQSFYDVFEEAEGDLLRIAAAIKHPSFKEEQEWRAVSPIITNYVKSPISYRNGSAMLVPYVNFTMVQRDEDPIEVEHIFLGPTPNINLSMNSLSNYLAKKMVNPKKGITYCQIPYRE
jgi:hypothetical protein